MKMNLIRATLAAACAALWRRARPATCSTSRTYNNPDVARAYSTPAGVESIIGTLYQQFNNGWNTTNVEPAAR